MSDLFNLLNDLDDSNQNDPVSRDQEIVSGPFGYPGGKDKSIVHLLEYLPVRDKWIDCCGGSGIVTLNRPKSKIIDVYNDRWSGVSAFFRCVRQKDKYEALRDAINLTMHSREEFVYCKKNWNNPKLDDVERACLFYNMLLQSFGKLGRNWARSLNSKVSFKRNVAIEYWRQLHTRFAECQIENLDVITCLQDYDSPGAVFYIDFPYLDTDISIYAIKATREKHEETLDYVFKHVQGYVAFSHYPHELYNQYPWNEVKVWDVTVSIDSKSSTAGGHRTYQGEKMKTAHECLFIREAR